MTYLQQISYSLPDLHGFLAQVIVCTNDDTKFIDTYMCHLTSVYEHTET